MFSRIWTEYGEIRSIRTLFPNSSIKDVKQGSKYADVITLNTSISLVCFFLSKNPYLYHFVSI